MERTYEELKVLNSNEYKQYLSALCLLASEYVSRIRVQFAEKAYEKYQDPTIRRIVLAYGEEYEKLRESRLRDFRYVSEYGATTPEHLNDFCLNHARAYGATIKMLFDIE